MSVNLHISRYKVGTISVRSAMRKHEALSCYGGLMVNPDFGPIFDLMKRTRANFKSTLRKCRSGNDKRTADSLASKFLNKIEKLFGVILEKLMSRTLQYLVL